MALGVAHTFQRDAAEAGEGKSFSLLGADLLVIEVAFAGDGGTVIFEAQGQAIDAWYPVLAENVSTGEMVTEARSAGLYRMNTKGLTTVRARIANDPDGDVSVHGMSVME